MFSVLLKSAKWEILLKCGVESICEQIKLSKWQVFVTGGSNTLHTLIKSIKVPSKKTMKN